MDKKLSIAQKKWLTELMDGSIKNRKRREGFICMQRGFTEWARNNSGEIIGEIITEKGMTALINDIDGLNY